jgi:hypothetical protein
VSFGGYAPTTVGVVALLHLYSVSGLAGRRLRRSTSAESSTARLHPAGSRSDQLATAKQGYIRRALCAPRCIAASSCFSCIGGALCAPALRGAHPSPAHLYFCSLHGLCSCETPSLHSSLRVRDVDRSQPASVAIAFRFERPPTLAPHLTRLLIIFRDHIWISTTPPPTAPWATRSAAHLRDTTAGDAEPGGARATVDEGG